MADSLGKLEWVHRVAAEVGVRSRPCRLRTPRGALLYLVPLLSWYHPSWDQEPDLPPETLAALYDGRASFEQRWADFRLCKWPEAVVAKEDFVSTTTDSTALADLFAAMNDPYLARDPLLADPAARREEGGEGAGAGPVVVISFSHFLPRQELCPEKRFLIEPNLPKVWIHVCRHICIWPSNGPLKNNTPTHPNSPNTPTQVIGSAPLGRQVRALRPDLHLFGHSHVRTPQSHPLSV